MLLGYYYTLKCEFIPLLFFKYLTTKFIKNVIIYVSHCKSMACKGSLHLGTSTQSKPVSLIHYSPVGGSGRSLSDLHTPLDTLNPKGSGVLELTVPHQKQGFKGKQS